MCQSVEKLHNMDEATLTTLCLIVIDITTSTFKLMEIKT